jgi:hypothetical protein
VDPLRIRHRHVPREAGGPPPARPPQDTRRWPPGTIPPCALPLSMVYYMKNNGCCRARQGVG